MIKIAHRGNTNGPNPELENSPEYILKAIEAGFDVEIDIWLVNGISYFGHDYPQYQIDDSFIFSILKNAWFHCKNIEILEKFATAGPFINFFWHQEDDYTLTRSGHIWTYPGKKITDESIIVELAIPKISEYDCIPYGICSDYVSLL